MTLAEIVQLLTQIINTLASMQGVQIQNAVEHAPFLIENAAINAELTLANPTYGLAALHSQIAALQAQMISDDALIVVDILTRQASGAPVTFPPTPPSGFGGSDMASAVWQYDLGGAPLAAGDFMIAAGQSALFRAAIGEQAINNYRPNFWIAGDWADSNSADPDVNLIPVIDPSTILDTDVTLKAWLERVFGLTAFTWTPDGYAQYVPSPGQWWYTFRWSDADFQAYKAGKFGTKSLANVPPVWPGFAKVTLGTEVVMSDRLRIDVPMDGCLVYLYSVPTKYPKFDFGTGIVSYQHLGAISFVNDNNDNETAQLLGMSDCLFVPKTMVRAAAVQMRLVPGVTAGLQPFTINP